MEFEKKHSGPVKPVAAARFCPQLTAPVSTMMRIAFVSLRATPSTKMSHFARYLQALFPGKTPRNVKNLLNEYVF